MATVQRDLTELATVLSKWLTDRASVNAKITDVVTPANGMSSETYLLDVDISESAGDRHVRWALRIEASSFQIYNDPAVEKQFRVLEALGRTSDIPVPRTHWYEPDTTILGSPFFLMDCVDGRAPPDAYHTTGLLAEATPQARETMWSNGVSMLARIHRLNPAPFAFLDRPDLGGTGLEQEVARWDRYRKWTGLPEVPVLHAARRWMEENIPASPPTGLAWGDARLTNILFQGTDCAAILDWETTSLSCAESDLGWWLYYDHATVAANPSGRLEGIGDRAATIALWEQQAGRKVQAMEWHEIFATWRFAWITEYAISLTAGAGAPLPASVANNNPAVKRLDELMS
jgi:aminoglycoside phosphotransferase (APT) family kinase protein